MRIIHKVKCKYCGKIFDRDKVPFKQISAQRYAHYECAVAAENSKKQEDRDKLIKELSDMFLDKQISDYRWEIINLADKISNGKHVSKECFKHAIATHAKYESIIEKYGLTNGEVEISMEIINEAYKKQLSDCI